jgi:hypothetical protein
LEYILKGTVSRDFRPLVFFTNQSHLGHWSAGSQRNVFIPRYAA